MTEEIVAQLTEQRKLVERVEQELAPAVAAVVDLLVEAFRRGKKLLVMGNGGSAADAQHFAAEIVGRFKLERRGLPAIALTTDTSILTAIGNDYGFDRIFSRQVEALAEEGDVVFGISTSGNSVNVGLAFEEAKERGCRTVAFLGRDGGSLKGVAELPVVVPSNNTPRIQETHITLIHIICDLVERTLFAPPA
ncbi:D-sedoheptulose 7-phosphate isomerase [Geomonas sp. RF6]|uniref:D-sedoheptulose 7-phosphate isomerase n=1 Tax=Geomonas sp. RF6 TaxID=2897342 RepID=UPI001E2A4C2B|nr:D-sedoheptulose 7-phosphate isomerase [Geomonas sp. RF6]UFS71223.1 D-sedoheptulose 7-phosphate isomerase [Geomonas sp. RF6]